MGINYRKVFDFTWKSNRSWSYTRTLLVFCFVFRVTKILVTYFSGHVLLKITLWKKIKLAYILWKHLHIDMCVCINLETFEKYTQKFAINLWNISLKNHFLIVGKNQWENRIAGSVELTSNNKTFILPFLMYQRLNFNI